MVEQISQILNTVKAVTDVNLMTIYKGKEANINTHLLRVDPAREKFTIYERHGMVAGLGYSWQDLEPYYQQMKNISFAINGYGNVKQNSLWRTLYQIKARQVTYVEGTTEKVQFEDSAPCHECGLLLPISALDVDHDRPQAGGEDEAVAKTFRAFGLTAAGPAGHKGIVVSTMLSNRMDSVYMAMIFGKDLPPVPTKFNRGPRVYHSTLDDRYTLNAKGEILYSVAVAANQKALLRKHCMSSLLNLQPMCGSCNSSKRNRGLKFA